MLGDILIFLGGMAWGWIVLVGAATQRAVTSRGWDDSNITNWLRMFSHLVVHPGDFFHAWYTKKVVVYGKFGAEQTVRIATRRVGWYASKDELSEVVSVRPTEEEMAA